MGWLTGLQHKPISGKRFNIPIYFDHDCLQNKPEHSVCFPVVSACAKSITFPVQLLQNVESFRELFILAYCKRQAFGRPWTNKWLDCGCPLPINWNEKKRQTMGLNKKNIFMHCSRRLKITGSATQPRYSCLLSPCSLNTAIWFPRK